jgi:hypothetical protein
MIRWSGHASSLHPGHSFSFIYFYMLYKLGAAAVQFCVGLDRYIIQDYPVT